MERIDQDRETRLLASKSGQQDAAAALAHQRREGSGVTAAGAVVLEQHFVATGFKTFGPSHQRRGALEKGGCIEDLWLRRYSCCMSTNTTTSRRACPSAGPVCRPQFRFRALAKTEPKDTEAQHTEAQRSKLRRQNAVGPGPVMVVDCSIFCQAQQPAGVLYASHTGKGRSP